MNDSGLSAAARRPVHVLVTAICLLAAPGLALAQKQLHWDRLEVEAHLDAAGNLNVAETHVMVFTGDWNGGERRFRLPGGQTLRMLGMSRFDGGDWRPLTEDGSLDDVDEFGWSGGDTLRWRSRRRSDPPFDRTSLRYQLRYVLSGALEETDGRYRLNHDFAFPERDGVIDRFSLRLTFDPDWQPQSGVRPEYTVSGLAPGRGFVLDVPLRFAGATPPTQQLPRRPEVETAAKTLLGLTTLAVLWFFVREQRLGRFAPLVRPVDEPWLHEHLLRHPAEVVGAAWDDAVGPPEVVALIARLVAEGKLKSDVSGASKHTASLKLQLKAPRSSFSGYERTLIDRLFYDGRTETTTSAVKAHYRSEGFHPADEIREELLARVNEIVPPGKPPGAYRLATPLLLALGLAMLVVAWFAGRVGPVSVFVWGIVAFVVAGLAQVAGLLFRGYIQWGRIAALVCLIPALLIAGSGAWYLWVFADRGVVPLPVFTIIALVAIALALTNASINALKSRQHRAAIAFRKALAAGRAFFASELRQERPKLRDEWYPWMLALELATAADAWTAAQPGSSARTRRRRTDDTSITTTSSSSDSSSASSTPAWTGFGGGRSGGAGGGATWAAAAGGLATGVSSASASSSGDSGSSSSWSSSSSDSSSSSSGGGGGGGW